MTWRLAGSLPANFRERPRPMNHAEAFYAEDQELDKAIVGPVWLKDPRVAKCVVEALRFGEGELKLYELLAYVVMANHVHVLLRPNVELARITKTIKGFTARRANEILGCTGERFWQVESYDHWVRDDEELGRIAAYIEKNPVSARLAEKIEDWPWSSAAQAS